MTGAERDHFVDYTGEDIRSRCPFCCRTSLDFKLHSLPWGRLGSIYSVFLNVCSVDRSKGREDWGVKMCCVLLEQDYDSAHTAPSGTSQKLAFSFQPFSWKDIGACRPT